MYQVGKLEEAVLIIEEKRKKKSYVKFLKRKRKKRNTKGILKILKEKKTVSEQSQDELKPIEDGIPYPILEDENK